MASMKRAKGASLVYAIILFEWVSKELASNDELRVALVHSTYGAIYRLSFCFSWFPYGYLGNLVFQINF